MDLNTLLKDIFRLLDIQKKGLAKLGLKTVGDLLYYPPTRYSDASATKNIGELVAGESVSIYGKIDGIKLGRGFRSKVAMASATIEDPTGKIGAVWFHQPYIAKMIMNGTYAKFSGKISENKKGLYISNPEFEIIDKLPITTGTSLFGESVEVSSFPIYSETRGITSKWIYHAIQKIFSSGILDTLEDPIPEDILRKYNLPAIKSALVWIHTPRKLADAEAARKRFAFEEVFFIQLTKQKERMENEKNPAFIIEKSPEDIEKFTSRFPFKETEAQHKAITEIFEDFKRGRPMSRLLEGDVGSGKTAVAATTAYAAVTTRPQGQHFGTLQVAYMCPTEILAKQHFESFIKYFYHVGISIALMTSSGCKKFPSKVNPTGWTDISRSQLLKWVVNGEISIVIGTHSLIQKTVQFKHLAYVIIDEQHRFGTAQRQKLIKKDKEVPHLLSMTATPIPRTLALTVYGDLDLTLLDQMPVGRKPIITEIIPPTKREPTYELIRKELQAGRQCYVICPRINEPDPDKEMALNAKSVKEEAKRLKKDVFPEYVVDIIHSKMTPSDKEYTMDLFANGKTTILVATSLVEVGVNVPNATVIVLEGAERFGLSQLHQLRGRVIRSNHQAYCYVFSDTKSQKSIDRLKALKTAKNGFELAEFDLQLRGTGELYGRKQWGVSDLAMEAMKNLKMVEAARTEARLLLESDPDLSRHPELKAHAEAQDDIHFE
ncbi:ATP-dependent DNA helicase RecG [Patescibacteria group bacterium]|nr:ATP-dependent DNA helicase RecG [Patescibacteria group bacterium]